MWTGAELLFFVTRLIINKVQWVDFKLENVLVSLHTFKTMGLGSIIFKEWRVTWTFSYTLWDLKSTKRTITLHSLKKMESFDNRFTSQVDFKY
jgi:hypothetical protein